MLPTGADITSMYTKEGGDIISSASTTVMYEEGGNQPPPMTTLAVEEDGIKEFSTTTAMFEEGGQGQHPFIGDKPPLHLQPPCIILTQETERLVLSVLRPQTPREHLAHQLLTPDLPDDALAALLRHFLTHHLLPEFPS